MDLLVSKVTNHEDKLAIIHSYTQFSSLSLVKSLENHQIKVF